MYFPPPRAEYSAADTSRITVLNNQGSNAEFVDFTMDFRYLGSIMHYSLTSDTDVDERIKCDGGLWYVFGAHKKKIY